MIVKHYLDRPAHGRRLHSQPGCESKPQGLLYDRSAWFDSKLEQSQMVGILGLQRAHQEFKLGKPT